MFLIPQLPLEDSDTLANLLEEVREPKSSQMALGNLKLSHIHYDYTNEMVGPNEENLDMDHIQLYS